MEATYSSELSVDFQWATQCFIPVELFLTTDGLTSNPTDFMNYNTEKIYANYVSHSSCS
jgi:hypothetical protein